MLPDALPEAENTEQRSNTFSCFISFATGSKSKAIRPGTFLKPLYEQQLPDNSQVHKADIQVSR